MVPSRDEIREAAQRVLDGMGFLDAEREGLATDIRTVCEAALRRVPPAPRDPRADYERVGSGFDPGAVGHELVGRAPALRADRDEPLEDVVFPSLDPDNVVRVQETADGRGVTVDRVPCCSEDGEFPL